MLIIAFANKCINVGGGGQPDSDMKVNFGGFPDPEIGIGKTGKIGTSDFLTQKFVFFCEFWSPQQRKAWRRLCFNSCLICMLV